MKFYDFATLFEEKMSYSFPGYTFYLLMSKIFVLIPKSLACAVCEKLLAKDSVDNLSLRHVCVLCYLDIVAASCMMGLINGSVFFSSAC